MQATAIGVMVLMGADKESGEGSGTMKSPARHTAITNVRMVEVGFHGTRLISVAVVLDESPSSILNWIVIPLP